MTHARAPYIILGVLLNAIDLFFVSILVFGGLNMMISHPVTGCVCVVLAPILLYLSTAVWTRKRLSLISRMLLYWGALAVFSVAVFSTGHLSHLSSDDWIANGLILLLLVAALSSTAHLRLLKRTVTTA
jgi:hypothetical protein